VKKGVKNRMAKSPHLQRGRANLGNGGGSRKKRQGAKIEGKITGSLTLMEGRFLSNRRVEFEKDMQVSEGNYIAGGGEMKGRMKEKKKKREDS